MSDLNRRSFLGLGALGLAPLALGGLDRLSGLSGVANAAAPAVGAKKMLIVFLRGGNDGTNSIIPIGDPEYAPARPTLGIPSSLALDLGNGWAAMHPSMAKLVELHELGELASIQRVGYPDGNLSHFSGQRFIETARIGDHLANDGLITRWAGAAMPQSSLPAVCVSREIQRMFQGTVAMPHIPRIERFQITGEPAGEKLLARLRDVYSTGSGPARDIVNDSGTKMLDVIDLLSTLPPHDTAPEWFPTEDTVLQAEGLGTDRYIKVFFEELRDAVRLLKQTEARVAGVEIPLWDHHSNQGGLQGNHPEHLAVLAHGIRSVKLDTLVDIWNDLAVVVISEFGRTSAENGSGGTDHGKAGAMWIAGGGVRGGVYNCDSNTWPASQTLFSNRNKWVDHITDYRAVLGEVFGVHMGSSDQVLQATFPGWSGFSGPEFQPLGLFL